MIWGKYRNLIYIILSLFLIMSVSSSAMGQKKVLLKNEKVVIYYFQDKNSKDKFSYYSYIISNTIAKELRKQNRFKIQTFPVAMAYIDRSVSLKERKSHIGMLSQRGKEFSAKYIITGSYYIEDRNIFIKTQIFNARELKLYDIRESSSEVKTILIEIIDNLTNRINNELSKFKEKHNKVVLKLKKRKENYAIFLWTTIGITTISSAMGYLFHNKKVSAEKDYNELSDEYDSTADPLLKEELNNQMNDEKDNADKYSLYRNISFGVGAASLLAVGFLTYKYIVYKNIYLKSKSADAGDYFFSPILCYGNQNINSENFKSGERFIGAMMSLRF